MSNTPGGKKEIYLRNILFGIEDSLVSTVGLLSGIAVASTPRTTIILTGVVLLFVEAFSMAVGSFLAEYSVEEYESKRSVPLHKALVGGFIMFISYLVAGIVPLAPYALRSVMDPLAPSIVVSLVALFLLGIWNGRLTHRKVFRHGVRMIFVGGLAIAVGILAGKLIQNI